MLSKKVYPISRLQNFLQNILKNLWCTIIANFSRLYLSNIVISQEFGCISKYLAFFIFGAVDSSSEESEFLSSQPCLHVSCPLMTLIQHFSSKAEKLVVCISKMHVLLQRYDHLFFNMYLTEWLCYGFDVFSITLFVAF